MHTRRGNLASLRFELQTPTGRPGWIHAVAGTPPAICDLEVSAVSFRSILFQSVVSLVLRDEHGSAENITYRAIGIYSPITRGSNSTEPRTYVRTHGCGVPITDREPPLATPPASV